MNRTLFLVEFQEVFLQLGTTQTVLFWAVGFRSKRQRKLCQDLQKKHRCKGASVEDWSSRKSTPTSTEKKLEKF